MGRQNGSCRSNLLIGVTQRLIHSSTTAYGGKSKIPGNLDILIAGFCCDDFSSLNSHRKNLNEQGESGDTFFSVLEYVNRYRPKIVILENIGSAPWLHSKLDKNDAHQTGLDKHFQDLGYVTSYMKLDTKDFYLPHTRQRGYMACVLRENFKHGQATLDTLARTFPTLVTKLERQASVPMETLMLDFDSPLLGANEKANEEKKRAPTAWKKCKVGHKLYRDSLGLGQKRPMTFWELDGDMRLPDYFRLDLVFTNRTTDVIDISHNRNVALKRVDDRTYRYVLPRQIMLNIY